ncbi:hypothetical protein DV736_g2228, partial [Chaetothyriales sp. CBS 134916]
MPRYEKIDLHSHYCPDFYREALINNGHKNPDGMPGVPRWSEEAHLEMMNKINYAYDTLNADGVALKANHHGIYMGDKHLDPVFEELNRRHAIVFIHPTTPCLQDGTPAVPVNLFPRSTYEFFFDTCRAVINLFATGTVSRSPNIKFIIPHMGGAFPPLITRFSSVAPLLGLPGIDPQLTPAFCLLEYVTVDRIVYGSDFPWTPLNPVVSLSDEHDKYLPVVFMDEEDREKLNTKNALKLLASAGPALRSARMSSEKKSIVIIGGGIIGSTTAYFLTRHPKYDPSKHSIYLLEATGIASGASGKAGGLLALWAYPQSLVPLSFRLHKELAAEHGGVERWGYRGVGCGRVELSGRKLEAKEADSKTSPSTTSSRENTSDAHVSLQKRSVESHARLKKTTGLPHDLDWIAEECVESYDNMGDPSDTAQVHPYQFTTSMASLASEFGANTILGKVTRIEDEDRPIKRVHYHLSQPEPTSSTSSPQPQVLEATDIIITAGPWSKHIWPSAPISNTRAHSVTIRPSRPTSAYCLFTSLLLPKNFKSSIIINTTKKSRATHVVTPEIYSRPNNEVYACGEGDHLVPLPASTADVVVDPTRCEDLIDYCSSISDELRDGQVLVQQACYLPLLSGAEGGPLVGRTESPGVWIAAGHTCWGIQNGPGTGKLMSEFIFDGDAASADIKDLDPRRWLKH